ncbi:PREDICTED: serine/threonine-protein kinase haspin [Chrysochloris asiatica]|uniref:Serine/threonine-protein kinase haspin n=1 Tax=Chrysochloris asiatica TaxID=185453 RepID=A0A9B0TE52_CHRAS|nr:PREDICTED: serine/threonine-protein kinase haspin [Chrysochloris asiatica]
MAVSFPRPGSRLFRTYGTVGGWGPRRRPGRAATQWFPPPDRKRFFSSSSSSSDANNSGPLQSVASDDPDDPDFRCSPVRQTRKRPGGRIPNDRPSLVVTPRRLRLRARPPQKCSTPCGLYGPPPFSDNHPGRLSPELSVCSQPNDCDELGTSASLFSSPASPSSPAAGVPALAVSVTYARPSSALQTASPVPRDSRCPAASPDLASPPCTRKAAAARGKFTRARHQTRATVRSALWSSVDSVNAEKPECGTDGKKMRGSRCEAELVGNRTEGLGWLRTGKNRATAQHSCQKAGSQKTVQIDYEESRGYKGRIAAAGTKQPERTGPSQKRKHQEVAEISLLHDHRLKKGQKMKTDSCLTQNWTHSQHACPWTKTRASLSFHKKKIVTAASEVCSNSIITSSPSESLLSEYSNSSIMNKTNSALSPWLSSSMYLLSPLQMLGSANKKACDAEKVYGECNQEGPLPFSCCLSTEKLEHCEKIGEGVFGEVFQTFANHTPIALKIIAIEGQDLVNGSHQKTFEEILPEIIISKELSLLSDEERNRTEGFIGLNSVHCVQGSYPPLLLRAWDHYHSTKGSANDRPDFFNEQQLFIVLEFEFGGTDLERMRRQLTSMAAAKSILHQITASLAVAESSLHFEHRDLHWGNVLLKKTSHKELHYTLNGKTNTIRTHGLQVNIIDYTLSRLERDGIVVFCDISMDEDLFTGEGDYQFEIYRLMRKENNNCWGEYHPYNNVLWLHYLTDKILKQVTFKSKNNTSALKQLKREIQHFHKTMLNFSSATELLCQHSLFK